MRIVLMGPPGAGKGTQAKLLAKKFSMLHLSSGDILRVEKASGSQLGRQLASYMDAGQLVPDDIVVSVMAKALTSGPADAGLLLDGFPRTVAQAKALDAELKRAAKPLDAVAVIGADNELIVQRITGRRSCPKCGRIYHVKFMPPRKDEICDDDGAKLAHRDDDTESVVRSRLEAYDRQTQPVIDYYRGCKGLPIIEIDGGKPLEQVSKALAEAIEACCPQGK